MIEDTGPPAALVDFDDLENHEKRFKSILTILANNIPLDPKSIGDAIRLLPSHIYDAGKIASELDLLHNTIEFKCEQYFSEQSLMIRSTYTERGDKLTEKMISDILLTDAYYQKMMNWKFRIESLVKDCTAVIRGLNQKNQSIHEYRKIVEREFFAS